MLRQTFVATGPIPELGILEGDVVEFDPSEREEPIVTGRYFGWSALPIIAGHPKLLPLRASSIDPSRPAGSEQLSFRRLRVMPGGA